MKKHFTNLRIALVGFLVCLMSMSMMAQRVTLDFTTNDWGFPTASKAVEQASFTNTDGYTIILEGTTGQGYRWYDNYQYLLNGQTGATLTLPAFDFAVEKIEVVGREGASTATQQNIFVGDVAVSTATTSAVGTNEYIIDENYRAAGNIYVLKVLNNKNTQITFIKIYAVETPDEPVVIEPTWVTCDQVGIFNTQVDGLVPTCSTVGDSTVYHFSYTDAFNGFPEQTPNQEMGGNPAKVYVDVRISRPNDAITGVKVSYGPGHEQIINFTNVTDPNNGTLGDPYNAILKYFPVATVNTDGSVTGNAVDRNWTVEVEWCTGEEVVAIQKLNVLIDAAPVAPTPDLDVDSIATLPYAYNFDEGNDPYFMINNGEAVNKWYVGQAQGFDNNKLYISSNNGTTNKYDVTKASNVMAYRTVMVPETGAILSFDYRVNGQANNDYLKVNLVKGETTTEIATLQGENDWASFSYDISGEMAGEVCIQFNWVNNATNGEQFPAAIDNISVIETPCSQPTALTATVDSTTAVITWVAIEGQTAWNFQYKLANHSEWYTVPATDTTITLTDLQGNSNYEMRVQAVCGENVSAWTTGSFAVDCQNEEIGTAPGDVVIGTGTSTTYMVPFNSLYGYSFTEQIYPVSEVGAEGQIYAVSFYLGTSNSAAQTNSIDLYMKNVTRSTFSSNTDYEPVAAGDIVYSGSWTIPSDYTGWVTITLDNPFMFDGTSNLMIAMHEKTSGYSTRYFTYTSATNSGISYYNDSSNPDPFNLDSYSGSKALRSNLANLQLNRDITTVVCSDAISCADPSNLEVSDITPNSAVLTWVAGAEDQTSFILEYQAEGATEWTSVDVNDTTYTLTELAQLTNYSVKVKANCGENNWSEVLTASFRTAGVCPPVTNLETSNVSNTTTLTWTAGGEETAWLVQFKPATAGEDAWTSIDVSLIPMTTFGGLQGNVDYDVRVKALCDPEDAENQSEWATTSFHSGCAAFEVPFTESFAASTMPTCWENTEFHFSTSGDGYAYSYTNGAELISPAINIPAENPTYLSFEVRGSGSYTVLASYRGTRADRFAEIYSGTAPNQNTTVTIALDDLYKGRAVNFKVVNNSTSYQYFYHLTVNQCPFEATALNTSNVTGTTVDLAWEADEAAANFQVQYGEQDFTVGEGTTVDVTDTTAVTISELSYETAYDFYVRVVCEGDNGAWAGPVSATTAPACSDPMNLSFDFTAAQLHWNNGEWGTPVQYNVRYKVEGAEEYTTDVVTPVAMPGYTPFYTISGLQSNTTYEMGVQSVCGENMESNWVTIMVTTPCMPIAVTAENPYIEGFDGEDFVPECWSKEDNGTYAWSRSTSYAHTGLASANSGYYGDIYLNMPALSLPANPAQLTFWSYNTWPDDYDKNSVMISTDGINYTEIWSPTSVSQTWEKTTISLSAYTNQTVYIAFKYEGDNAHGWFVDDVTVEAPSCSAPDLSIAGLTATITPGNFGTPVSYDLMIGEQTATVTETTVDLSTVFTLDGNTTYQVSVRANCGDEDYSDWSAAVSFTTPCMPISSLPWNENFEGFDASTVPNCWDNSASTSSTLSNYPERIWGVYSYSGNKMMRMYNYYVQSGTALINSPEITLPNTGVYVLKFDYSHRASCGAFKVKVMEVGQTEAVELGSYTSTGSNDYTNPGTFTEADPISLAAYAGRSIVLQFFSNANYGSGAIFVDNVAIEEAPSCMKPSAITVDTVTETTAQVSWTAGGSETEWEVSYTIGDQTITETTTENPYTITGLSASTHYVLPFSVKAICSATDESEVASTELIINTVCGLAAVPFAENFDTYTSTTTQSSMVMPLCWNRKYTGTSTSYGAGIYNSSSYAVSGTNSLRLYSYCTTSTSTSYGEVYAVLPQMDAAINTLMISFDAKAYNSTSAYYGSRLDVGVVTDAANPETSFTLIQTISAPVAGERFTIPLSDYSGNGYIAFRETKEKPEGYTNSYWYNYTYVDNILVEAIPTCFVPSSLTVSEVTDHTAAVNWADSYDQAAYAVEYMAEGDATWTSVSVDTTYALLNNLQASTNYTVRVKAVCGTEDESEYSDVVEFTTICEHGVQVEFTGTSTSTYIPTHGNYNYSFSQQIFKSSEINAATTISGFEIEVSNTGSKARNIDIYMMHTSANEITSWLPMDNAQLVYSGVVAFTEGWQQINFDTPFNYNGTDNLVLIVDDNTGSWGSYPTFRTHDGGSNIARYYYTDSYNVDPFNPSATAAGYSYSSRNNIRITNCPEATDLAITDINTFADACDVEGAVTIGVKNMGYEGTVSTFEAYYQMNEETPVHETVTLATPIAFNEAATYTFNQLPAFTTGENIITAWVELTGDLVDGNNTKVSAPITVLAPIAVPYEEAFTGLTINHGWNPIDANNDGITMNLNNNINYTFNDEVAADDWMMSPCIEMAAGTYTIIYDYKANSSLTESFEVFYGNGAHIADMTNAVAAHTFNNTTVETATTTITIPADGIYNFGFHATSLAGNLGFTIDNFKVYPVNDVIVTYNELGGTVTPNGTIAVNYGENLTLNLVPAPMYHVAGVWVDDVQVVPEDGTGANFMLYTLENVTEPHTVFVDFKLEFHIFKTVENYRSDLYSDFGGAFVPAATDTTINPDPFTVNMVADPHYHLAGLTLSPMVPDNPEDVFAAVVNNGDGTYSYTIDTLVVANYYVNAIFRRDTVAINYTALTGKGYANDSPVLNTGDTYTTWVDYSVNNDVDTTITFAGADNYHVADVIVNGVSQGHIDAYTFENVTETQTVGIKYGYKIDAIVSNYNTYGDIAMDDPQGTIVPTVQYIPEFDPMTVTGTVAEHFHLYQLLVNGENRIDEVVFDADPHSYSFTMDSVDNNYTIVAVVKVDTFAITYDVIAGQGFADASDLLVAPATYSTVVNYGDNWMSTITPDRGFAIANVGLDGENMYTISNNQFNFVETDHLFTIIFAANTYTVNTNAYGEGTVSDDTTFVYDPANPVNYEFVATPAEGYYVSAVVINNEEQDLTDVEGAYTTTIEDVADNYVINAHFSIYTYTMTAEATEGGTITPADAQTVNYGTDFTYEINANEGWYIASTVIDGVTTTYTQDDALVTLTVPYTAINADHSVSVTFAQFMYTITATAGEHGTVNDATSVNAEVAYGTNYTLNFTPADNYQVADVIVDGQSVGAVDSYQFINITANHTVEVSFEAVMYTLTATSNTEGCTITPATTTVQAGSNVSYTVSAASGYHLLNVTANGEEVTVTNNAFTINNVQSDYTIFANFAPNYVTVTVNQPAHATITPGTMTYAYGATPAYMIVPEVGYEVVSVTAGNAVVPVTYNNGIGTFTLDPVHADITLTATTSIKKFTITVTQGANGTIAPGTQTNVEYGTSKTFQITANQYYVVADVIVDGSSRGALTSYTFNNITGNHTITAVFEANCQAPTNLTAMNIDTTSALISWVGTAPSYEVRYKAADAASYTTQTVTANSLQLTGLTPNTLYEYGVRSVCGANLTSDWVTNAFTTKALPLGPVDGIANAELSSIKVYSYQNNVYVVNEEGIAISNIDIYDIYGKQVYTGKVLSSPEVISLSVANGNYVVRLATENGVGVYKVAIVR
ncbi:MAG: fibronectin type III domain-containing protein [Bacteroidales bacterium]|nr:fibronectin type III domain-containing protein [Bacteroidales bacterium]